MTDAGNRLLSAVKEARQIARGEAEPAGLYVPPDIDVRLLRHALKLTQDEFARAFGFSSSQIRDWEQGRHRPLGSDRAYLMLISRDPHYVQRTLSEAMADLPASRRQPGSTRTG